MEGRSDVKRRARPAASLALPVHAVRPASTAIVATLAAVVPVGHEVRAAVTGAARLPRLADALARDACALPAVVAALAVGHGARREVLAADVAAVDLPGRAHALVGRARGP